ncbi:hypothetical protein THAOC_12822 [Thalassiosira oceanica]|uniref:Uncharacterized protein n=1 Tax=Thalassiosira oceanica TaxID=159749 RepID=K0SJ80_THAOC|nr:hypothetical protein THAOC_12822 [Thalassiosira oceanica]|eukprot:EJK66268.1 hypothetical protein THAOC_12822 [Thalassiosira oceanica]
MSSNSGTTSGTTSGGSQTTTTTPTSIPSTGLDADFLKTMFVADPSNYVPVSEHADTMYTKEERDNKAGRAYTFAQALMVKEPADRLSLGLKLAKDGQVSGDAVDLAGRHVTNSYIIAYLKQRMKKLAVGDMVTILIPKAGNESKVNAIERYDGSRTVDLFDQFRSLNRDQVIAYGLMRETAGKHGRGDANTLRTITETFMDSYLKASVDRAYENEESSNKCALLYLWILLQKILFIDERTVTLLVDWMKNVADKGTRSFFGGNIAQLAESYKTVCNCLVSVNRLPKKAYVWLLKGLSNSEWEVLSKPFTTRLNNYEEQNLLQEVVLTVPLVEQKQIQSDVETLAKEASESFETKIATQEISLRDSDPASMNAFGVGGKGGGRLNDKLKSNDPIFDGVEVEMKQYSNNDYAKLSREQKQLLRIKRIEAGLDPRTGKKPKEGHYRRKDGWSAGGGSTNLSGGNSGVQIIDGKAVFNCKHCGQLTGVGAHTSRYCSMAKKNPHSYPAALPDSHPYHKLMAKCAPVNGNGGGSANQQESGSVAALTSKVDKLTDAVSKMAALQGKVAAIEAKETESPERARQYELLSKACEFLK